MITSRITTFAVTADTNDLYLDQNGNIAIIYDLEAVLQACGQAAKTILGEMVLQTNQGIPYFESVWNGVPNLPQFEAVLRTAWLAVPGVLEIVRLVTTQTNNVVIPGTSITTTALIYSATIRTEYGTGNIASEGVFNG